MNVGIIGTGYVGLVTGTCFAEMGNDVICVDVDERKVRMLAAGELPLFEPGLEVYLERNLREGRLHFTTSLSTAVEGAEILFLALPTPPGGDGSADLSFVLGVSEKIAEIMKVKEIPYRIIVNKSTVPVGTAERVSSVFEAAGLQPGEQFDVVSNPEFLREGVAVDDFMKPERVVVGTSSDRAAKLMTRLYEPFVRQGNPILVMDERSSEMTKYAANAFLATKITFMNEIANLCDRVGANVDQIRRGIGLDSRIGNKFLYAGIGFGGSCFPKDVQALSRTAEENDYDFQILRAVLDVNDHQRRMLADRVVDFFGGTLDGRRIAVWGLAFKPNTDDVREAPSHVVINRLVEMGASVGAFDPEANETTRAVLGDTIDYYSGAYEPLEGADALVICTEWHEFRRPDFERIRDLLRNAVIFDGRNLYAEETMREAGFEYHSIGRPPVNRADSAAPIQDDPA
jgi:UDPglucose 6-dehydrogenase